MKLAFNLGNIKVNKNVCCIGKGNLNDHFILKDSLVWSLVVEAEHGRSKNKMSNQTHTTGLFLYKLRLKTRRSSELRGCACMGRRETDYRLGLKVVLGSLVLGYNKVNY